MKIISIEEHFLTRQISAAWEASSLGTEGTGSFDQGEIGQRLLDLSDGRLALMDESGIDVQVLSVTTPALHNLEPEESVRLASSTNDLIAAAVAKHPTRFEAFAILPMPAPQQATMELERAVAQLGLSGAMVCGRTREMHLDNPAFFPLFRKAEDLCVPVFVHPQIPQAPVRAALYSGFGEPLDTALATFGLGWHYEAGIQFVRLILAGVFDRLPKLQVILGHWGELVLFYLERLKSLARVAALEHPIEHYFEQNLYVTPSGMWSNDYLHRALKVVGPDRILFSTDFPYQYRPGRAARTFLLNADLLPEEKEAVAYRNWEKLMMRKR